MSILDKIKDILTPDKTKTVYRVVSPRELELLQNSDIDNLGTSYYGEQLSNTHKYSKNEKYLHFFDSSDIPDRVINSL